MSARPRIKICGITNLEDAERAVDAGADALGLNFWPGSPRRCDLCEARRIAEAVGDRVRLVAVHVDADREVLERVRDEIGIPWIQLHGEEPAELVEALGPRCFKALKTTGAEGLALARRTPGEELLLDARVPGHPGGTGQRADWDLAAELARERRLWLAGGLTPALVAEAARTVRPFGVDVASGVERAPGIKDPGLVRAFVAAVQSSTKA